jgi:hypothetical protein
MKTGDNGMTPERLAEIEARTEAATPGPWFADSHVVDFGRPYRSDVYVPFAVVHAHADHRTRQQEINAAFIAHARADVPDLVAEVHRLRAVLDATQ